MTLSSAVNICTLAEKLWVFYLQADTNRYFGIRFVVVHFIDDHSRVRLQRNNIDYINASLVEVPDANRAYIMTQVW